MLFDILSSSTALYKDREEEINIWEVDIHVTSGNSTMENREWRVIVSTCLTLYKLKYSGEVRLSFPFAINEVNKYMFSSLFLFS